MNRKIFQKLIFFGFFIGSLSVNSESFAKNPFQSYLPERPKKAEVIEALDVKPILKIEQQVPKVEVKIIPPVLVLNGLIWNSAQPQAIVDGQVVKVGDVIKDVKIKRITRNGVEGNFQGVRIYLKP